MTPFNTPLLEQFKSFCKKNNPQDLEKAIEYFAIFGGLDDSIDTSKPRDELIKIIILDKYKILHPIITKITHSNSIYHSILTAIALGDGRIHSAYKRAKVSDDEGDKAVDFLLNSGIVVLQTSKINEYNQDDEVSAKLVFSLPFLRFWFAFISPIYKGISTGDYEEFQTKFKNRETEFVELIFEQLSSELIRLSVDGAKEIGSYWCKTVQIPIYSQLQNGQILVATSKYTNQKMKKSELVKLQEATKEVDINADIFVLVSKNGFSNELKGLKSQNIKLLSLKNFKILCEN